MRSRFLFVSLVLTLCVGLGGCAERSTPPAVSIGLNATTIYAGESTSLTWSSTNTAACVANGSWSGTEQLTGVMSVTETVPATYTFGLDCSGAGGKASGSATLTVNPHVVVDAGSVGAMTNRDQFGTNMCVLCDTSNPPSQGGTLKSVGVNLLRWSGGTYSDEYHWQTNAWSGTTSGCGYPFPPPPANAFDNFESTFVGPQNFDVMITVNYGTNAQCDGPADPNEAAGWVAYAKQKNYGIQYWTVGNEVYGDWEPDLHSPGSHDAATYANSVATQFYPLMKAQDPTAQIGIVVNADGVAGIGGTAGWDSIVLPAAKYDFVELHYYPQLAGSEDDSFLLTQAPGNLARTLATIQQELAAAGHPNTPIFLGEYNSVNTNPGKQTVSIVNALYAGMVQGEIMKAGLFRAVIHDSGGSGCNTGGNNSPALYGWQSFGSYDLFPLTVSLPSCSSGANVTADTPFPTARSFALSEQFGLPGSTMLGTTVSSALPNVRAYADQQGSGYGLMLFNLDEYNPATIYIGIANAPAKSYTGSITTYDRAIYDQSQTGLWAAPATQNLGTVTLPLAITMPPWSMNVITLQ